MRLRRADHAAWRNLSSPPNDYLLVAGQTPTHDAEYEPEPCLPFSARTLAWANACNKTHEVPCLWVCWIGAACILALPFGRRPRLALAVAWVPVGYFGATSLIEFFLERYNLAIAPFVLALIVTPFGWRGWRRSVLPKAEILEQPLA
jgi:hypothetical protein